MKRFLFIILFLFLLCTPSFAIDLKATWQDNSNNELGFRLEQCAGVCSTTGQWAAIASTGVDATSIYPLSIVLSQITSFRVVAFNLFGESSSNIFIASPPAGATLFSFTTGP